MSKISHKNIILHFKGHLNYDIIGELIGALKDNMKARKSRFGLYKKLLTLLIESLENIVRYNLEISEDSPILKDNSPEVLIAVEDKFYILETSNIIARADIPPLENRISALNRLNKLKIKDLYKATITDGKFSEKGGAGLGIIEMAKIIDKKMEYSFTPLNEEFSLFRIKLYIRNDHDQ